VSSIMSEASGGKGTREEGMFMDFDTTKGLVKKVKFVGNYS